jgi:uridylate kinase
VFRTSNAGSSWGLFNAGLTNTVVNALALQDALEKIHVTTRVQTAISMSQLAEPFMPLRARRHLEKGRVVIFAAGLGDINFLEVNHQR